MQLRLWAVSMTLALLWTSQKFYVLACDSRDSGAAHKGERIASNKCMRMAFVSNFCMHVLPKAWMEVETNTKLISYVHETHEVILILRGYRLPPVTNHRI